MKTGNLVARTILLTALLAVTAGAGFAQTTWLPPITPATTSPNGFPHYGGDGSQSSAYDAAHDRLIVFGGVSPFDNSAVSHDTWVLVNASGAAGIPTWNKLQTTNDPPGRLRHSAVYDPVTNRMIVFGGTTNGFGYGPFLNDVWILTNANGLNSSSPTWVQRTPSGGPPDARSQNGAIYDQAANAMTIFFGSNPAGTQTWSDVWVLQDANDINDPPGSLWQMVSQSGSVPSGRGHFATGYDPASHVVTIFGGCCGYSNASFVGSLDLLSTPPNVAWTFLTPGGTIPPAGDVSTFGYDPGSNRLVVLDIVPGDGTNGTWLLSDANAIGGTDAWTNIIPGSTPGIPPRGFLVGSGYNPNSKILIDALNAVQNSNQVPQVWLLKNADGSTPFLSFPLHGVTPSTASISTVMDHHVAKNSQGNPQYYAADNLVDAYTGEEGTFNCTPAAAPCVALNAQGNPRSPAGYKNTLDQPFAINGYYTGGGGCYDENHKPVNCKSWLFYEGHPGFDYPTSLGTSVFAPAPGVAFIPDCDPITRKTDCTGAATSSAVDGFNILTLDHGNGYSTWYLHMGDLEKVKNESATIPQAPFQVAVAHAGEFQSNLRVVYAARPNKKLKKVRSNPTSGQYTVDATGVYTFSLADSGLGVLISYYYAVDFRVITCPGQASITLHRGDGQRVPVTPQCTIGQVGNKAIKPNNKPLILGAHLHFEVRKGLIKTSRGAYQCALPRCVPIDPYGWKSSTRTDPYPFGPNILLWNDPN